jgi:formate dehydrogenase subunit gamma
MDKFEIISIGYKIAHHWNLILFTLLALTGAVLFSIEVMGWLAYVVGAPFSALLGTDPVTAGVQLLRSGHWFIGFVWGALLIVYTIYLLLFGRIEVFKPLSKPLSQQIKEMRAVASHYMLGKPLPPEVAKSLDRHNVLVSYMTIVLIIAVAFLSISGVALAFKVPLSLSPSTVNLLVLLHDVGFVLGLLFVALHLFAVLHPANRPILMATFGDGKADLAWLKAHMPRFLERRGVK